MSPLPLPPANATLISLPSAQDISSPEFWTPNATQRATLIVMGVYVVAIGILWHVPLLCEVIYPFKLLTVGMHELSHALAGVLTCARIESIQLEPNEGGCTRMRGGVQFIVLPAGYLGSSFIGAALIACGFDINASKVACLVMAAFFVITLYWARRSWVAYATFMFTAVLIVVAWLVHHSVALRFFVLFLGVMSCLYCIWDIIDDTLKRKIASSDASQFAKVVGFGNSYVWGAFWLIISILFFGAGIAVGLAVFKSSWEDQMAAAERFLGGTPW
ncbi:hypothetical protein CC85DRAFT_325221 [Cutaneotrichosporon oleaginosum]|uniref:Peptidase M50B-like-domain-containing protein n=1 Tax=Cutaneotrichosporon oleaginosum TaxID=879819 RepID=A0A0J0XY34_9TREE|nr:uncharacterized protein CC85DRAFT_325221 [Cutaneotrichosporon oleaginosum]KLT45955.1 hypothetical protein CC85DRAFT_325221 [Cutaneotrichosporon oleaginosum]